MMFLPKRVNLNQNDYLSTNGTYIDKRILPLDCIFMYYLYYNYRFLI